MQVEIKHRWTGAVLYACEVPQEHSGMAMRYALEKAVAIRPRIVLRDADLRGADLRDAVLRGADLSGADLSDADLRDADLRGADLRSFKADMWATLTENRAEVSGLIKALREGRINGSQYTGSCACLVGTIANVKGVDYSALTHSPDNPAERWFMMIREGDKPGDDTAGGFAASKALEWALEYCALTGIAVPEPEAA